MRAWLSSLRRNAVKKFTTILIVALLGLSSCGGPNVKEWWDDKQDAGVQPATDVLTEEDCYPEDNGFEPDVLIDEDLVPVDDAEPMTDTTEPDAAPDTTDDSTGPAPDFCWPPGVEQDCSSDDPEILGVCASGVRVCEENDAGDGVWSECNLFHLAVDEKCDGLDNNCDGAVDEDLGFSACGVGACETITATCVDGEPQTCVPGAPTPELCDGLDNDCDGAVDEDMGSTTCGLGVCEHTVFNCTDGVLQDCDPFEGAQDEVFDGLDNDCNGVVDNGVTGECLTPGEEFPCGFALEPVGECTPGVQFCGPDKFLTNCIGATMPSQEICDGLDNNCNGLTDENFPTLGEACDGSDADLCENGAYECNEAGNGLVCMGDELMEEICNGLDDDCDGVVDEDLGNFSCGTGECEHEVAACVDGFENICDQFLGAELEVCDGVDNDCDGLVDENQGTKACGKGICEKIVEACVDGITQVCDPGAEAVDEICNGKDDDCDGAVDEDFDLGPCTVGNGVCEANGFNVCTSNGGNVVCDVQPNMAAAGPEQCNDLDDDCDGETDEDFLALYGEACTVGKGLCARSSVWVCNEDPQDCLLDGENTFCTTDMQLICLVIPLELGTATAEQCDGLDNDCDGLVDEDYDGAVTCGIGECEHTVSPCLPGGIDQECDPMEGAIFEICDGLDNDCDGLVDEDLGTTSCGIGQCAKTISVCVAGVQQACDPLEGATDEICDGVDNDCDTSVDELLGTSNCGLGACAHEIQNCSDGQLQFCNPFQGATPEDCETMADDDCDGEVNEGCECTLENATQPCGLDTGLCVQGAKICVLDEDTNLLFWSDCIGGVGPDVEICDGKDNDCDGSTDENLGVSSCGVGQCGHTVSNCVNGTTQVCDPLFGASVEICDGVDNDCDGLVDENLGTTTCGLGACVHTINNCTGGVAQLCNPYQTAIPEVCDGLDNDCDGDTDEGLGATTCGIGACEKVVPNCSGGIEQVCDPLLGQAPESCNSLDDDCDGLVDEDFTGTATCGVGACEKVLPTCLNGTPFDELCAELILAEAKPEVCGNGVDDDCDGVVDEGMEPEVCGDGADNDCDGVVDEEGAQGCTNYYADVDGDGFGHDGLFKCLCAPNGAWSATVNGDCNDLTPGANPGVSETCDGIDNDCDGAIDESLGTTSCGIGACINTVQNCVGGNPQACLPGNPAAETCDGIDNDCDGQVDEGLGATTCGIGACTSTVQNCVGGNPQVCLPGNPGAETCNSLDDDCDGNIDEGFGATTCGVGACEVTMDVCSNGQLQQCTPGQPSGEVCNGIDDNCDGQVDEDFVGATFNCGTGICANTVDMCVGGQLQQCVPGNPDPQGEVCGNGLDDDCDGAVDEPACI